MVPAGAAHVVLRVTDGPLALPRRTSRRTLLPGKESDFTVMIEREKLARAWERVVLQASSQSMPRRALIKYLAA